MIMKCRSLQIVHLTASSNNDAPFFKLSMAAFIASLSNICPINLDNSAFLIIYVHSNFTYDTTFSKIISYARNTCKM